MGPASGGDDAVCMKDIDWEAPRRIEQEYRRTLAGLMDRFSHALMGFGITDPYDIVHLLHQFTETNYFASFTQTAASRMVTMLTSSNHRTWLEAAAESSRGRLIYEGLQREMRGPVGMAVQALIDENARLISTFPLKIAEQVNRHIFTESQKGRTSEQITGDLLKQFTQVARGRIKLIARTEVSKASTALTRVRSESLGLPAYIWKSSEDQRVRPSHRFMSKDGGVIVFFSDPPLPEALIHVKTTLHPGNAGDFPNCRCYCRTILDLNKVSWSHRVYHNGTVRMMTRSEFSKIAGVTEILNVA